MAAELTGTEGADPADPPSTADDPLRLTACLGCGYALEGLPDAGRCPECGQPYDRAELILFGIARGALADAGRTGWWRRLGHVLLLAILLLANVAILAALRPRDPVVRTLLVLLLAQAGFFLFARLAAPKRDAVQVRLNAAGASQEGAAPPDAAADRFLALYSSCMPGAMLLLCAASTSHVDWRPRLAWAGGAAMLLAVAFQTIGPLRRGSARLLGASSPSTAGAAEPAPWPEINDVTLEQTTTGSYHLRLGRSLPSRVDRESVNVELSLTEEEAEAVRAQIEAWRNPVPAAPDLPPLPAPPPS